jgi:pimeloyl-ACP methyl ester carboxylesterase
MASRLCRFGEREFEISYEILNPNKKKYIIFLHGWGSNKEIMKQAFGKELVDFTHIYIDMPGFGRSPNDKFLSTYDYAKIIQTFLDSLNISLDIVVGHSFGGKVATLLNPKCLVLLSSAGVLVPKPLSIKLKIAIFKIFKVFGVSKLRSLFVSDDAKNMNPGMYETFKYVVNEDFEDNFSKVTGKALLFWGKADTATPLWTAKKIDSLIRDSQLFELEGDHFFFLKQNKFIATTIEKNCK